MTILYINFVRPGPDEGGVSPEIKGNLCHYYFYVAKVSKYMNLYVDQVNAYYAFSDRLIVMPI